MKNLILALGISFAAAFGIYSAGHFLINNDDVAKALAALPIVGCQQIAEMIERQTARRNLTAGHEGTVQSFEGFCIPWPLTAAYATFALIAVIQASSFLIGAIIGAAGLASNVANAVTAILLIDFPIALAGAYFVGQWVGTRSRSHGIFAVLTTVFLSVLINQTLTIYFVPQEIYQHTFQHEKTLTSFIGTVGGGFLLLLLPCLIGYWRGSKRRMIKYMQFLFAVLPADTKSTLVDLASQEANRVRLMGA